MLALTLGDPLSVNIELVVEALHGRAARRGAWGEARPLPPLVFIGSHWQWLDQWRRLGENPPELTLWPEAALTATAAAALAPDSLHFVDIGRGIGERPAETLTEDERGTLAVRALELLPRFTGLERLAVVTAPIDKHACAVTGWNFPGQTEFFAAIWQGRAVMILAGPRLRVALATNHLPLKDVASSLTVAGLTEKILLFVRTLRDVYDLPRPRLALCGLNPHAGDQGLFGDEEAKVLVPALRAARQALGSGAEVEGPLPADTVFHRAYHGSYDGVMAIYHDQGLGPLKTVHFDDAVNLSGGLRHFRASPDHGPARDLFLGRRASPTSLLAALDLAVRYWQRRGESSQGGPGGTGS